MSNIGTMEQEIYETLQSLVSKTKIRHRILSAARFHREKRYFFSERTFTFKLTRGRSTYRPGDGYGLPEDLVEILGETLYFTPEVSKQPYPIERLDRETMDWDRAVEAGTLGEPDVWDWWEGGLRLSPTPDNSADTIEGPYVRDLGVPRKKYDTTAGSWSFWTPDGATTLEDDFGEGNHWFDLLGGFEVVKHRALYLCFSEILKDPENAQQHMMSWIEEKSRLEDETEGKSGPDHIPASLF